MKYKLITGVEGVDRSSWDAFVSDHPMGTVFQSPDMFDLYSSVTIYSPLIFTLQGDDLSIKALLLAVIIKDFNFISRKFSSRTLVYGGPLIHPAEPNPQELADQLLDALKLSVQKKCLYIQFRNLHDLSSLEPAFRNNDFILQDHLNLIVPTSDSTATLSAISKSKVRQAKQSLQNGATLVRASTEAEVVDLYRILEDIYRKKVKKPLPPESFFLSFFRASQLGKIGLIFIVKYKGDIVGGMVCPLSPGKSLNEWYICGLDKAYREIHPSVLLTFSAIEYAIHLGLPYFDFMGIGSPDIPYRVRDFKTKFGGNKVNYGRYIHINHPLLYPLAKAGFSLLAYLRGYYNAIYHK